MNGYALGSQTVIRTDDLEVELRADPHGVGIDQLLDHKGATVAAPAGFNWTHLSIFKLGYKAAGVITTEELGRGVLLGSPCRLVEVIQVEPAILVLPDGDAVYGNAGCVGGGLFPNRVPLSLDIFDQFIHGSANI